MCAEHITKVQIIAKHTKDYCGIAFYRPLLSYLVIQLVPQHRD